MTAAVKFKGKGFVFSGDPGRKEVMSLILRPEDDDDVPTFGIQKQRWILEGTAVHTPDVTHSYNAEMNQYLPPRIIENNFWTTLRSQAVLGTELTLWLYPYGVAADGMPSPTQPAFQMKARVLHVPPMGGSAGETWTYDFSYEVWDVQRHRGPYGGWTPPD